MTQGFAKSLSEVRRLQIELARSRPYRDAGLVGNPSAREADLVAVERRLGLQLPPSYRAFLLTHDGWPRFFAGASLLGTRSLGQASHAELVTTLLGSANPYGARAGVGAGPCPPSRRPLPFGIDPAGTTLFAFDLSRRRADGECEVVAWLNEVGVRRPDFTSFLGLIAELCQAEIDDERGAAREVQSTQRGPFYEARVA
ncbi:MAG: SMI1/KNR4 family protein [Polyangiaceae bacterium]|nr:SMI1/KNR4 family protein [Polyangiaceae bacterium]MCW5789771.1 SMI1/KNR4 family protein [Polyangiaceae bacterium]